MKHTSKKWIAVAGVCAALCGCNKNETAETVAQNQDVAQSAVEASAGDAKFRSPARAESGETGAPIGTSAADAANPEPKGVLCEDDYCKCGNIGCGRGSRCDGGACVCGNERSDVSTDLYRCEGGLLKCIGTGGFDACECGAVSCSVGANCIDRKTCACDGKTQTDEVRNAPEKWRCSDGQWRCASGSRNNAQGCGCADAAYACGWGATCENGRCMCGNAVFEGDPATYECDAGRVVCGVSEGCPCGNSRCGYGATCRDGACFCGDTPWQSARGAFCEDGQIKRR